MVQKHGLSQKTLTKRIDAFEMWTYRRMLRISWKEHKPNEKYLI